MTNTDADTFRNNPWIMNLIVIRDKETKRERDSTVIPGFFVHMHTRAHFLTPSHKLSHPNTQEGWVCVYVRSPRVLACVIAERARSRRARQFMGRVPWPDIRVQIREKSKQVVVQRCGLTSECLHPHRGSSKSAGVFGKSCALDRKRARTL